MNNRYTYEYPRPAVTVDVVALWPGQDALQILLIERKGEPFAGAWALPGGFLEIDEELDDAAARELAEETGITGIQMESFGAFGTLGRDPRTRTISIAYASVIDGSAITLSPGDDAARAEWFDVDNLPELAFDHADIVARARRYIRETMRHLGVGIHILPERFSLDRLRELYERLAGVSFDSAVFNREMLNLGVLDFDSDSPEGERMYRFNPARLARF